jgi:hypothetical protein
VRHTVQADEASYRCGGAVALVAQNMGRTGPIDLAQGEISWAALLLIALLWALISVLVAAVSVRNGMRRLAWGWTASFVLGLLVATHSFWRL